MLSCTFAGHRDILHSGVEEAVKRVLDEILERDSEFCFYTGGMGAFDALCEEKVRSLKRLHADKQIHLVLVEPYMKQSINVQGEWLKKRYDEIIIPEKSAKMHPKAAIQYRNRWMIEQSQYMIAYVHRDFGGAHTSLQYAQKHGLFVLMV